MEIDPKISHLTQKSWPCRARRWMVFIYIIPREYLFLAGVALRELPYIPMTDTAQQPGFPNRQGHVVSQVGPDLPKDLKNPRTPRARMMEYSLLSWFESIPLLLSDDNDMTYVLDAYVAFVTMMVMMVLMRSKSSSSSSSSRNNKNSKK